ncbi:MAG: hypothetical protein ACYC91_14380 [Solirubrobacteraceae bacterium]
MRRRAILIVAVLFITGLLVLTVVDVTHNGVTPLAVLSLMILVLFTVGILGALRSPPRR